MARQHVQGRTMLPRYADPAALALALGVTEAAIWN
jgi:hypothetical protein